MRTTPAFRRPTLLGLRLLLPAAILLSLPFVLRPARADDTTASVGYISTASGAQPGEQYLFQSFGSDYIYFVPFAFNALGNYKLDSVSLLLSAGLLAEPNTSGGGVGPGPGDGSPGSGDGGPGGGGSDGFTPPQLSSLSITVYSTLPTSFSSLPSPIVSFSPPSTEFVNAPTVHTFTANSEPTLTAGTKYYLAFHNVDDPEIYWVRHTDDTIDQPYPGDRPVTELYPDQTGLVYHSLVANGTTQSGYQITGGFSITATAVSAVPEPATIAVILGGSVLAAALWVRRRGKNSAVARGPSRPQS